MNTHLLFIYECMDICTEKIARGKYKWIFAWFGSGGGLFKYDPK